jgi:iron(III) transport system permease protein
MKPSQEAFSAMTFSNYFLAFQSSNILRAIRNSFFVSFSGATVTVLMTAIVAWVVVRTNIRGKQILDQLASFTLVLPSVVLGMALLLTYLSLPIPIYGTIWILIIAYITRYTPYGVRYSYAGLLQINKELEESGQMSGASWGRVFRKIIIPLMMPSLFAGWIYIFLLSVRELPIALLLYSHSSVVISVTIFDMWEYGRTGELAALSVSVSIMLVAVAVVFQRVTRRHGLQV